MKVGRNSLIGISLFIALIFILPISAVSLTAQVSDEALPEDSNSILQDSEESSAKEFPEYEEFPPPALFMGFIFIIVLLVAMIVVFICAVILLLFLAVLMILLFMFGTATFSTVFAFITRSWRNGFGMFAIIGLAAIGTAAGAIGSVGLHYVAEWNYPIAVSAFTGAGAGGALSFLGGVLLFKAVLSIERLIQRKIEQRKRARIGA